MRFSLRIFALIGLICLLGVLPASSHGQPLPAALNKVYLPLVTRQTPWPSPFGIEATGGSLGNTRVRTYAQQLGARWVRLNTVSWRQVQPQRGGPYNWSALASFEKDLLVAAASNLTPIVVVDDSPDWATINVPYATSCGAIRGDRFADYAAFMSALVNRYKGPPYNAHTWELGNEIDVDPRIVPPNNIYGCWGKIEDPYYGGEHYGNMLKVVTPAIRQADPTALVMNGGLLLGTPNSTTPGFGKPEKFLEGILRAGAANSFDIVAYHSYQSYTYQSAGFDYDLGGSQWSTSGGLTIGKSHYLRAILSAYGVNKPLMLNEGGMICSPNWGPCQPPGNEFFQAQSDYVVRMLTRGWADDLIGILWYTLDGPGWRSGALLDSSQQPRPVYKAYQNYIAQTSLSDRPVRVFEYGPAIEAYRFNKGEGQAVDILWSVSNLPANVVLPVDSFIAATAIDGTPLTVAPKNNQVLMSVSYRAIYIKRKL